MAKPNTFPALLDDALQIHLSKLKAWGYLQPGQNKTGTITWSRQGNRTGRISIRVNTLTDRPFIELDYSYNEEPRKYIVELVAVPSNLGIGMVWYFLCPKTRKRCRILYSIDGYFLHRTAFAGSMYEKQTHSKSYRELGKLFGATFKRSDLYYKINQKHFKKFYAGKPTKRYLKFLAQM